MLFKLAFYTVAFVVIMFVVLSLVVSVAGSVGMDVGGAYPGIDAFLNTVSGIIG